MTFQARQGDVLVQQVLAREPIGTPISDQGRVVLAYGETSGHVHEVIALDEPSDAHPAASLVAHPDGGRYLFVDRPCVLTHDEHNPIALGPGAYQVILQREYEPTGLKHVAD